jgi:hypothetical protein
MTLLINNPLTEIPRKMMIQPLLKRKEGQFHCLLGCIEMYKNPVGRGYIPEDATTTIGMDWWNSLIQNCFKRQTCIISQIVLCQKDVMPVRICVDYVPTET